MKTSESKPTKERKIEQEVRKVIQSVALHGYDCVLAEKDIFKAVQKFYKEKLRKDLIAFDEWYYSEATTVMIVNMTNEQIIDDFLNTKE